MSRVLRKSAVGAALVALASSVTLSSMAAELFQPVPSGTVLDTGFVSRGGDTRPVTVMVVLAGEPVAAKQKQLGRKLTRDERDSVIKARLAEQKAAQQAIEHLGGKVLAFLQSAIDGIKVQIPRNGIAQLRSLPGVVDVKAVGTYERLNVNEVNLVGAPQAWQSAAGAFQGQGVKIAIVDTGIDYTHADFGGPGTVAAYNAAKATDSAAADPALFGPAAPKVKGGTDLVGDAYTGSNTPVPDPNPLDCVYTSGNVGHGSHVAGTAAGFGVTAAGVRYTGPYNAAAYTPGAFSIGPGVAPLADIYSVRVFGCSGNTNVIAEAIDWAVANGMDVISMSLGSDFGNAGNGDAGSLAEAQAVANATAAGILVVAASGNSGQIPYITSSPAVFEGAISVAATDALAGIPTANLALPGGGSVSAINANGATYASPTNYPVRVLRNADGTVSLGCDPNEYDPAVTGVSLAGKMVVTARGNCSRVYRAGAAQHFGAAAALMINNAAGLPPYEGPIPGGATDPTSGNVYETVTIPFFGISLTDGPTVSGPTGGPAVASATATNTGVAANAGFEKVASFSSGGPRIGDSVLRPGITAPGVSVVSVASGTGNGFQLLSGTSMATPVVAGVAALAKQAHPTWSQADLRAAVVQTSSPTLLKDLLQRNEGAGLAQAQAATATQAIVRTPDESMSFGFADLLTDFNATKTVTVHNTSPKAVQFNIAVAKTTGPAGTVVTTPASVIVNANADVSLPMTLQVPANAVGGGTGFQDIGGYITLAPSNSRLNGNVKLTVPYYLVAHSRANLAGAQSGTTINLTNAGGQLSSQPVPFILGQYQPTPQGIQQADVRAVGARISGTNIIFGVNTHNRTSTTLAGQEYDICIDTSGNPSSFTPNKVLIGINGSRLSTSLAKSQFATAIFPTDANCNINGSGTVLFTITQPTDNSTLQLPVTMASLGITAANPRLKYVLTYYGTDGGGAQMPGIGWLNGTAPAVTFSSSPVVPVNGTGSISFSVNSTENAITPALGVMLFGADNVSGAAQGLLFTLP